MDFVKNFRKMLFFSAAFVLIGLIVGIVMGGLNMGIDFTGGTIVTLDIKQEYDANVVTAALAANGIVNTPVVKSGPNAQNQSYAVVRMRALEDENAENQLRQTILAEVQKTYPGATLGGVERVGGIASASLVRNAFFSVLLASVLMMAYIWFRFEWKYGVSAVLTLLHDVVIMVAFMAIARVQINSAFIAAALTIVGLSINNTIVIFDRIRENLGHAGRRKVDLAQIANTSIKETLLRSINTTITTLFTIACVYILGVDSIKEFTLPIIIGLIGGAYSSIFLAAPLWYRLHMRFDEQHSGKAKGKARQKARA